MEETLRIPIGRGSRAGRGRDWAVTQSQQGPQPSHNQLCSWDGLRDLSHRTPILEAVRRPGEEER